jgi:hypothetical protein
MLMVELADVKIMVPSDQMRSPSRMRVGPKGSTLLSKPRGSDVQCLV